MSPLCSDQRAALGSIGRRAAKAAAGAVLPASALVVHGSRGTRRIALTFDDGPSELTRAYLDVLDRFGAKATFFVVGDLCSGRKAELDEMDRRGHELAGHGYTHRLFPELDRRELEDELARTLALLPTPTNKLVRPPQGCTSVRSLAICTRHGFTTVLWSIDSKDWCRESAAGVLAALEEHPPRSGDIVLLHEGQPWTLEALPRILTKLEETGHESVTVSDLIAG